MATRSLIAAKIGDRYHGIYCHNDGYPSWNGRILRDHYTTQEKVEQLLALGDLSLLGPEIGPGGKGCFAYGRDRGESGAEAIISSHPRLLSESFKGSGVEFCYLWDGERWLLGRDYHVHEANHPLTADSDPEVLEQF